MARGAAHIGDTEIARRVYAGRYADILADTIDSGSAGCEPPDVAFVVGALSFVGRIEEGELFLENHRRSRTPEPRTLSAGGFFLTVAYARSGDFVRAGATVRRAYRETSRRRDPWCRAFLFQAIACCHYFAARYTRAAQAARNAQAAAQEARFAYLQMLATDMRAHVLTQRGELEEGLRLLSQARDHARKLGLDVNARVFEVSIAIEQARVSHPANAVAVLEKLIDATDIQDGYSRRLLLAELSKFYALLGRARDARRVLEEAVRLSSRDARAQAALACARAEVGRVTDGWERASVEVALAREAIHRTSDPPRQVEISGLTLAAATFLGDAHGRATAIAELERLYAEHQLYRAISWLHCYGAFERALAIDELARVMRSVVHSVERGRQSREATQAILRTGLWGLLAEASGLLPGRRVHLFEDAEVLEDAGEVRRLEGLPPRGRAILKALAGRALSKERLLQAVWGVASYRADRHDSIVKTTISRLRSALGRDQMWIETVEGGYRVAEGIEIVEHGYDLVVAARTLDELSAPPEQRVGAPALNAHAIRWSRLARELSPDEEKSVGELAMSVRASIRTVSRDLSEMLAQGLVERVGQGRSTRYRGRRS